MKSSAWNHTSNVPVLREDVKIPDSKSDEARHVEPRVECCSFCSWIATVLQINRPVKNSPEFESKSSMIITENFQPTTHTRKAIDKLGSYRILKLILTLPIIRHQGT